MQEQAVAGFLYLVQMSLEELYVHDLLQTKVRIEPFLGLNFIMNSCLKLIDVFSCLCYFSELFLFSHSFKSFLPSDKVPDKLERHVKRYDAPKSPF